MIPEDALTIYKTLGKGEFGVVQQGVWTNDAGDQVRPYLEHKGNEHFVYGRFIQSEFTVCCVVDRLSCSFET